MVRHPVSSEPVSTLGFPVLREVTGNSTEVTSLGLVKGLTGGCFPWLLTRIPYESEQGNNPRGAGKGRGRIRESSLAERAAIECPLSAHR